MNTLSNATPAGDMDGVPPLGSLPSWLDTYSPLRPEPAHPWAARFTALVAQALPAATLGLTDDERAHVEALLFARLMTDTGNLNPGSAADAVLDQWLAVTVFRASGWTATQRRAWWHVETLAVSVDILAAWTAAYVTGASPDEQAKDKPRIGQLALHWIELARHAAAFGEDIAALHAFTISENLLECAQVFGYRKAIGLHRGSMPHTQKLAYGSI